MRILKRLVAGVVATAILSACAVLAVVVLDSLRINSYDSGFKQLRFGDDATTLKRLMGSPQEVRVPASGEFEGVVDPKTLYGFVVPTGSDFGKQQAALGGRTLEPVGRYYIYRAMRPVRTFPIEWTIALNPDGKVVLKRRKANGC